MGKVSNEEIVRHFEARLAELLRATDASRVTLRLDHPERGFHLDDVVAEVRREGVPSLKGQTAIDQRRAPTVVWLDRERRSLIQNDLAGADPAPPPQLVSAYGTKAQMLAPIVHRNDLVGIISVHENGGPRRWRPSDVEALEAAAAWFTQQVDAI